MSAPNAYIPKGSTAANPEYLVDANGAPITQTNPLFINAAFSATEIAIGDNTTPANTLTVDSSGNAHVLDANSAAIKADADTLVTQTANVAKETGGNLAASKSDLDSLALSDIITQVLNGKGFIATTGQVNAAADGTYGLSFFHPSANTKNVLIYSIKLSNNGGSSMASTYSQTTNPALDTECTVNNAQIGGSSSSIANSNVTFAKTTAAVPTGTLLETAMVPQSQAFELLASPIFIAASTAGGVGVYDYIASSAAWSATIRWIEF
jgi:hypothetical protein